MIIKRRNFITHSMAGIIGTQLFSMRPLLGQSAAPKRLLLLHQADGVSLDFWPDSASGQQISLSRVLQPLSGLESEMSLVRGISLPDNSHAWSSSAMYTGKKGQGGDKTSVNQPQKSFEKIIAQRSGFPDPLYFGCVKDVDNKNLVERYLFYDGSGNAVTPYYLPQDAFGPVFGSAFGLSSLASRLAQTGLTTNASGNSLLAEHLLLANNELIKSHALAGYEKAKIQQFSESLEKMRQVNETVTPGIDRIAAECKRPNFSDGLSLENDHQLPIFDGFQALAIASFVCGVSPIVAFQHGKSASEWKYNHVRLPGGGDNDTVNDYDSHKMTHSGDYQKDGGDRNEPSHEGRFNAVKERMRLITQWHAGKVAEIANTLKGLEDVDGSSMLDNTLIVWASEFGSDQAWNHRSTDIPYVLVGGKNLGFASGKYYDLRDQGKPNGHVLATIAQQFAPGSAEEIPDAGHLAELLR